MIYYLFICIFALGIGIGMAYQLFWLAKNKMIKDEYYPKISIWLKKLIKK